MPLEIFNSLTKKKEVFVPLRPGKVSMYVCGNTVYDYCHMGHARSMVVFDVITRYLRYRGYDVTYVRNITDIDDKIIHRAAENGETCDALTTRFIHAQREDEIALNILSPDKEPRATQYMAEIIQLVQRLLDNDSAYVADNGDICFDVRRFNDYGKLSHCHIEDLMAGARVEVGESKRNPLDFVLWKLAKPGEPKWPSPWGEGRPGWHIECSAMSSGVLGQPFDIHGGGLDLKFPHHENEVAQSEAAYQTDFARIWMHAGLLQVNNEKMSKSLGNFFTIREVLKKYPAEEVRYFILSGHYRSPINYTEDNLAQVHRSLVTLYTALRDLPNVSALKSTPFEERFINAMDDDFNFPQAFGVFFDMAREINRLREQQRLQDAAELGAHLQQLANIFGLLQQDPTAFLQGVQSHENVPMIEALIEKRLAARREKNWLLADEIRAQLTVMGIVIEDHPNGTTWRKL
ncbi:MAG: cysteine--tRNA ligase [Coxiella sp. RIFCSPHIGHO2_12_FULL_42_15]|nr:MAG: cysteine--tRNA ligase [Coxiella sp. RIFCSPHIGHO2_12_FULL_42_15]